MALPWLVGLSFTGMHLESCGPWVGDRHAIGILGTSETANRTNRWRFSSTGNSIKAPASREAMAQSRSRLYCHCSWRPSKPLHALRRDNTDDVGQIARAKASGERQLHRLAEFFNLPPILDPVAWHRREAVFRPSAATAFAEHDLPKNAAPGRSQCSVPGERFSDALRLSIHYALLTRQAVTPPRASSAARARPSGLQYNSATVPSTDAVPIGSPFPSLCIDHTTTAPSRPPDANRIARERRQVS